MVRFTGEHTTDEIERWRYREVFLRASQRATPEVLRQLLFNVFDVYVDEYMEHPELEDLAIELLSRAHPDYDSTTSSPDPATLALLKRHEECLAWSLHRDAESLGPRTREAFGKWCASYHVHDGWLIDLSIKTLFKWHVINLEEKDLCWSSLPMPDQIVDLDSSCTSRFKWNPCVESRTDAELRLKKMFDKIEDQLLTTTSGPLRRGTNKSSGSLHFEWLALHHFGGLSYRGIADHENTTFQNVRNVATELATKIGLTLRNPGRGRPRKKK